MILIAAFPRNPLYGLARLNFGILRSAVHLTTFRDSIVAYSILQNNRSDHENVIVFCRGSVVVNDFTEDTGWELQAFGPVRPGEIGLAEAIERYSAGETVQITLDNAGSAIIGTNPSIVTDIIPATAQPPQLPKPLDLHLRQTPTLDKTKPGPSFIDVRALRFILTSESRHIHHLRDEYGHSVYRLTYDGPSPNELFIIVT